MDSMTVDDKKSVKREAIAQAAAAVFAERGLAGATMADIAARAGVGKGTVYEYYTSKEDLFFAVFEWLMGGLTGAIQNQTPAGASAVERLRALSEAVVAWIEATGAMYSLTLEFWAAAGTSAMRARLQTAFRQVYREYRTIVADILREGQARGEIRPETDTEAIAASLVGMWDALGLQAWMFENMDAAAVNAKFLDALLTGLTPRT